MFNGKLVPMLSRAKYLGCMINDKGDPKKEVNKRIGECMVTWKRLAEFWKHSDCSVRQKLVVHDAVIQTKLVYALESVQINDAIQSKLDVFQLKGLRQILKIKTTYVDRTNTNEQVFEKANAEIQRDNRAATQTRSIIKMSTYCEIQRWSFIAEIIRALPEDTTRTITMRSWSKQDTNVNGNTDQGIVRGRKALRSIGRL